MDLDEQKHQTSQQIQHSNAPTLNQEFIKKKLTLSQLTPGPKYLIMHTPFSETTIKIQKARTKMFFIFTVTFIISILIKQKITVTFHTVGPPVNAVGPAVKTAVNDAIGPTVDVALMVALTGGPIEALTALITAGPTASFTAAIKTGHR
ncbi:hypothetical protein CYY_006797 [Polysphondylium violaceum]|uniref:Uncharacterized protein n=1 Tax=Polysphondylium violaceum TaxID=133409 RepID=A0A8J4UY20_9MYCE|nr:hypothetical protein CYY_006797 [Polysphondylium violaceum]